MQISTSFDQVYSSIKAVVIILSNQISQYDYKIFFLEIFPSLSSQELIPFLITSL